MRALFLEVLLDIAQQNNLGITADCLQLYMQHIDAVIAKHGDKLQDRDNFVEAYAESKEFVQRMVRSAINRGYSEFHEGTYGDATSQCGLIWFCGL